MPDDTKTTEERLREAGWVPCPKWAEWHPPGATCAKGSTDPLVPTDEAEKWQAVIAAAEARGRAQAEAQIAKLEQDLEDEMQRRDRFEDAITEAHVALGGDGEWRAHVGGAPPPPHSGTLTRDVPVMARALREEARTAFERGRAQGQREGREAARQEIISIIRETVFPACKCPELQTLFERVRLSEKS